MEEVNRYLSIAYLVFGMVLAWVLSKSLGVLFLTVKPSANVIVFAGVHVSTVLGVAIAAGVTWYIWQHERWSTYLREVADELAKVTYPSRDETYRSTYVVVIFSVIVAIALALFDLVWKFATDALLSV
jgi:preprotein translocase SecE subunit